MARETVLWPLSVTLLCMALALLLRSRIPASIPGSFAIGAGFMTGYALIYGIFSFPPSEAQGWLPALIALNFLVFSFDDHYGFPKKARRILQGVFSISGPFLILSPLFRTGFSGTLEMLAASAALWFALWVLVDGKNGPVFFLVAAGNAVVSATTGSTLLGQLGGVLTAVLGGHFAFNFPQTRISLGHAGTAVVVTILASLMLIGRAYADTALLPGMLLLLAFPLDEAARRIVQGRMQTLACALFALIPVGISAAMAVKSYLSQEY